MCKDVASIETDAPTEAMGNPNNQHRRIHNGWWERGGAFKPPDVSRFGCPVSIVCSFLIDLWLKSSLSQNLWKRDKTSMLCMFIAKQVCYPMSIYTYINIYIHIYIYIICISIFFLNQSIEFRMLKISTTRSTAIKIWSNAVEERRCYRATAFLVNPSRADTIWKCNDIHVMSPWQHMKTYEN